MYRHFGPNEHELVRFLIQILPATMVGMRLFFSSERVILPQSQLSEQTEESLENTKVK